MEGNRLLPFPSLPLIALSPHESYSFTLLSSSPGQICGLNVASTSLDELSPNAIATTGCLYILIESDAGMAALARWSKRHLKKGRSEYVCVDMDSDAP